MPRKRIVERSRFGYRPIHCVGGVPWPRINSDVLGATDVPLKEEYLMRSMDYLDTPQARKIFEAQADIIVQKKCRGIVDVGCRVGMINDILYERKFSNYNYMGFDTSREPITFAKETWAEFKNIEFRNCSWDDLESIDVDFNVDCVIWSGVLLYRPEDHQKFFDFVTRDFYTAKYAIIQEPMPNQRHWLKGLSLNTIAEEIDLYRPYYKSFRSFTVDADIFSGYRKIVEIEI